MLCRCSVCSALLTLLLGHRTDMKQWWLKSHPYEVNFKMSCPLLVDMFAHMDQKLGMHKATHSVVSIAYLKIACGSLPFSQGHQQGARAARSHPLRTR